MKKALIIVDVQNDFCEDGALPVKGGNAVAAAIREHVLNPLPGSAPALQSEYALIVASRDWHEAVGDNGGHFAAEGEKPNYTTTWPPHCVEGTAGASYHSAVPLHKIGVNIIKGMGAPAYSAFEGTVNSPNGLRTLLQVLQDAHITDVDVVGLAKDHCVKATALDAANAGFDTVVIDTLTASVDPLNDPATNAELDRAGVALKSLPPKTFDVPDADWNGLTFTQRLHRLRDEITLDPNMRIIIRKDREEGGGRWYFQVAAFRPDTFTGAMEWGYGGKAYLSPHATRSELVQTVFGLYLAYVEHEARETFKWRDRRVFGPHVDVLAHWEVAGRIDARPNPTRKAKKS